MLSLACQALSRGSARTSTPGAEVFTEPRYVVISFTVKLQGHMKPDSPLIVILGVHLGHTVMLGIMVTPIVLIAHGLDEDC